MVPIHIANHEESCARDQAKDAARRTVNESRETRSIDALGSGLDGLLPKSIWLNRRLGRILDSEVRRVLGNRSSRSETPAAQTV